MGSATENPDGGRRGETSPRSAPAAARLTPKQARFVAEYLKDCNATQAAVRSGYSKNTAESQGSRLLRNARVCSAVAEGQARHLSSAIATREERQKFWTEVMAGRGDDVQMRDRLKASELLGKSEADFTEKVQHSGAVYVVTDSNAGFDK